MKKIILLITLCSIFLDLQSQSHLYTNIEGGLSSLYFTMPKDIGQFFPGPKYLNNRLFLDENIFFQKTIGITYQKENIRIFNKKYHVFLEGNFSHREYNEQMNLLIISSNLFMPKKDINKNFNTYYGVRFSHIVINYGEKNLRLNLFKNVLGAFFIIDYNITKRFKLGFNSHLDISRLAIRDNNGLIKNRTFEALARLSYKIK